MQLQKCWHQAYWSAKNKMSSIDHIRVRLPYYGHYFIKEIIRNWLKSKIATSNSLNMLIKLKYNDLDETNVVNSLVMSKIMNTVSSNLTKPKYGIQRRWWNPAYNIMLTTDYLAVIAGETILTFNLSQVGKPAKCQTSHLNR